MNEQQQRIYNAGKKAQEIEDMQLLGAILKSNGGFMFIPDSDLLEDCWVERSVDNLHGGIRLRVIDKDLKGLGDIK
jgi:hypothetical protein